MNFRIHKLIGLGIFVYIVYRVDCRHVVGILSYSNPLWLFFAFLMSIPHILLKSMRWKYLLKVQGYSLGSKDAFLFYLSGIYLGMVTPGKLGELYKVKYLEKAGIVKNRVSSLFSVIIDRVFDLVSLFVCSMLGIIYFDSELLAAWWGWLGLGIGIFSFFFLCKTNIVKLLFNYFFKRIFTEKSTGQFSHDLDSFIGQIVLLKDFRWIPAGILTILSLIIFFVQCVLISFSITIPVNYFQISFGMAMANFVSMLPITIAGLGTRESVLYFFLGQHKVSADEVMAYSIGILVVFYIGGAVLGLIAWLINPVCSETKSKGS